MAHLLAEIHRRLEMIGRTASGSFELPITQVELADCLGLSVVHANRTLQQLTHEGFVATERKNYHLLEKARLEELGQFDPIYLHQNPSPWRQVRRSRFFCPAGAKGGKAALASWLFETRHLFRANLRLGPVFDPGCLEKSSGPIFKMGSSAKTTWSIEESNDSAGYRVSRVTATTGVSRHFWRGAEANQIAAHEQDRRA
jgi:hypothetical protein